ncbi:MAG: NYN domain-containing protein [Lamprobacter sp.]|uniref:NYN domain-containing protein n=1 Tax=Lamprobacter sp. TaxID=3100796 RepID=UPI002B25CB3B|nr:NYN domain-containing protein [Lamprobacter sp.]MEA3642583.1 NYN domain-containing protein [Lamprobacter sp.]
MIRKIFAIDLTPCDIVARERGAQFFPVQAVRELIAGDDVDVLETLVTLVERVAEDNPESIASNKMNFTRKQHALEESGARVIRAPAKRLPDGGFKQSDDQRLIIATLSLALRLRPEFLVLAAADGDFAPMVWELRNEGIRTEVLARPQMLASDLRRAAYSVIDIDDVLNTVGGAH